MNTYKGQHSQTETHIMPWVRTFKISTIQNSNKINIVIKLTKHVNKNYKTLKKEIED